MGVTFPHLDQAQLDQLCQVRLVDHLPALPGDVLQRPSQIDGFQSETGQRISNSFSIFLFLRLQPELDNNLIAGPVDRLML